MSARYVWKKYNIEYTVNSETVKRHSWPDSASKVPSHILGYCCKDLKMDLTTGKYTASGETTPLYFGGSVSCKSYPYFLPDGTTSSWMASVYTWSQGSGRYWNGSAGGSLGNNSDTIFVTYGQESQGGTEVDFAVNTMSPSSGSLVGTVSSASKSTYPSQSGGGISGNYWYTYLGSDSIDPTEISVSKEEPRPGDKVTVSITPRTNTYGGTISYFYQYSVNGGGWTDIKTTTETSVSFTIPANAKTIQFRARAQDNMGFTSTTYVTSTATDVERLNLWVGVNGKARKGVEMYVGVNGKARKVTAAYIGVNGKARRFL